MAKKYQIIGLGLILLLAWLTASRTFLVNQDPVRSEEPRRNMVTATTVLYVGEVEIPVEVRRTPEELSLGLSYRESLMTEGGMAFVYPQLQQVMYWMKGMQFPLDFIWVANGIVVEITESVPAPTEDNPVSKTVVPAQEVDMVIEVNSGFVQSKGIRVGDEVRWVK